MRALQVPDARPRPRRSAGLLLAVALLASLLATSVASPVQAAPAGGVDAPQMPKNCFGPGQTSREPTACKYGRFKKNRPTVVLWGDSHAYQYIPAVRRAVRGEKVNFVSFVAGSCPPIATRSTPATGYSGKCERNNVNALAFVKKLERRGSDVKVVLGSNWAGFRIAHREIALESIGLDTGYDDYTRQMVALSHEGTPLLFKRLGRLGVDVDVVSQAATVPGRIRSCDAGNEPYACNVPRWRAIPEERRTESWLRGQMSQLAGRPGYLTPSAAYCNAVICAGVVDGIFTWYDSLHLSATRTRALASFFKPSIRSLGRG